jgi:hypothetical protein
LREKEQSEGIALSDFKIYYKIILIKQHDTGLQKRDMYQWNRMDSLEVNPPFYGQLIFSKCAASKLRRADRLAGRFHSSERHHTMREKET